MDNDKSNNPLDTNAQYINPQPPNFAPAPEYQQMPAPKSSKKPLLIVIIVVVLAMAGAMVWAVGQRNKIKTAGNNSQSNQTNHSPDTSTSKAAMAARDTERAADIKTVAGQLEAYNAIANVYPTLNNINDSSWVSANLLGLNKEATRDPSSSLYTFAQSSIKGQYGYNSTAEDGTDCDNAGNNCSQFTLTYTTEDGTQHSVKNQPPTE